MIWTVEIEPCGLDEDGTWYEGPNWYYIVDGKLHCFGYAPGFMQALWHYVRSIPAAIALDRWYRD